MAHSMTRRTLREHCFKLLFCTDFYPPEEAEEQIEDYFRSEKEEETDESGSTEVLHLVELSPEEEQECRARVDARPHAGRGLGGLEPSPHGKGGAYGAPPGGL